MNRRRLICLFYCYLLPLLLMEVPVSASQTNDATAITYISPIQTSMPGTNGTIIHVVQYGQSLYSIAAAYGLTINQLKVINKLSSDDIYEGQKLIIKLGDIPTATLIPTDTPTRTPRPTRTPTQLTTTQAPILTSSSTEPVPTPTWFYRKLSVTSLMPGIDPILIAVAGLGGLGLLLIAVGSVLKKKR